MWAAGRGVLHRMRGSTLVATLAILPEQTAFTNRSPLAARSGWAWQRGQELTFGHRRHASRTIAARPARTFGECEDRVLESASSAYYRSAQVNVKGDTSSCNFSWCGRHVSVVRRRGAGGGQSGGSAGDCGIGRVGLEGVDVQRRRGRRRRRARAPGTWCLLELGALRDVRVQRVQRVSVRTCSAPAPTC